MHLLFFLGIKCVWPVAKGGYRGNLEERMRALSFLLCFLVALFGLFYARGKGKDS